MTAHKLGGPKGAGALLVRRGLRVPPLLVGGAQERARRGGIEDVPAWVGFGAACAVVDVGGGSGAPAGADRAGRGGVRHRSPASNGSATRAPRVRSLTCCASACDGVEAEPILLALDQHGVAVHSGSSCSSEMLEPSPVLEAMGVDADHSLRVSVGWSTIDADIDRFVEALPGIVERFRGLRTA